MLIELQKRYSLATVYDMSLNLYTIGINWQNNLAQNHLQIMEIALYL